MRTSSLLTRAALGATLLASAVACSSQNASSGDGGTGTIDSGIDVYIPPILDADVCNNHGEEVDNYFPGLTKAGEKGVFDIVMVSSDPSPPTEPGTDSWIFKVVDKSGATVKDVTISMPVNDPQDGWQFPMNPWMPFMTHGGTVTATVTNHGDGTATAVPEFNMHEYWRSFVCAQSGSMTDCAQFNFCLP